MINIICEVSKYLVLLFMVLYTVKCFSVLSSKNEEQKRKKLNKQIGYVFVIHFLCYLILYLRLGQLKILIFYVAQIFVAILYMVLYHSIYKDSSRLLTNNASFLLLIGYIMLTRLNFNLAVKLLTVFIPGLGSEKYGSRNWINLGHLSVQPMEFVKILFVFFVASMLVKASTFKELFVNALISAAFMGVLVLEKDLGAAVIFYITYVLMVYVATSRPVFLVGGISLGAGAVMLGYALFKNSLFQHVMVRVHAWQNPFADIDGGGYQLSQSLFAIGTGGYAGSGLTQGAAGSIPVSESDFIFSAICEELGVIFGLAMILVIVSIFLSFANVAMKCKEPFYKYVALGFSSIYIVQCFLNLGGVTKFIPSTGVTLPLVSYGVSSVLSTLIIFAIVQGVYVISSSEAVKYEREKEKARQKLREQESAVNTGRRTDRERKTTN